MCDTNDLVVSGTLEIVQDNSIRAFMTVISNQGIPSPDHVNISDDGNNYVLLWGDESTPWLSVEILPSGLVSFKPRSNSLSEPYDGVIGVLAAYPISESSCIVSILKQIFLGDTFGGSHE